MAQVTFKRGSSDSLKKQELKDGLLSFTLDDGQIHLDYVDKNNVLHRKTFYGGTLTFGKYKFDGTQDVNIDIYEGEIE